MTGLSASALTATTGTAAWTAPTGVTAPTYKAVVSTTSGSTTDPGVTATVNGSSASISGMTPGTSYYVSVTDSDGTATSVPVVTTLLTRNNASLLLAASKAAVVDGASVTLHGVLTHTVGTTSSPLANVPVSIYTKPVGGALRLVGTPTTSTSGAYSFVLKPTANAAYAALYLGSAGSATAAGDSSVTSNVASVSVAAIVTAKAKKAKTSHKSKLVVTGKVTPNESGRTVTLVRIDGGGEAVKLATTKVTTASHFTFRTKKPKTRGTYHLEVKVAASTTNAAAASKKFTIHRT